jgi:hypothetical protein
MQHPTSPVRPVDVAQIRFENAVALFDEFVYNTIKHPDAATLRGLERRFAERVQVQPSYWSQIKSRSRQIGERLARQFEQACHKPHGWMDQAHSSAAASTGSTPGVGYLANTTVMLPPSQPADFSSDSTAPQDDDERFIVGLVLTYYRRHPKRARARLLDLLGEVLAPVTTSPAAPQTATVSDAVPRLGTPKAGPPASPGNASKPLTKEQAAHALWLKSQSGVAPLRQKK